jgi:CubicO group peptidase (beta-lactamase class C family)
MNLMHGWCARRGFFLGAVASMTTVRGQSAIPRKTTSPKQLAEKLDSVVPELLRATKVPGLAVSLVVDGQVAWTKGFGVRSVDRNLPVDGNTVFEAASLSKPAFSYAVLRLVEGGKLDLDEPLTKYLDVPWVANEARLERITARMVLSHTSGLPHGRPPGSPIALRFDPGAKFAYSANGIEYLRAVVEKLSGSPLAQFMKDGLLRPQKMDRSSFGWEDRFRSNYAEGHSRSGRVGPTGNGEFLEATEEERGRISKDYPEYRYPSAAAGLYTTAGDYARFMCAMMRDSDSRLIQEMVKAQTRIGESLSWGLGWGLETTSAGDAFWHWGDWGVFRNFAMGYRSTKMAVVVLTNSFNGPTAYQRIVSDTLGGDHPAFSWVDRYRP